MYIQIGIQEVRRQCTNVHREFRLYLHPRRRHIIILRNRHMYKNIFTFGW